MCPVSVCATDSAKCDASQCCCFTFNVTSIPSGIGKSRFDVPCCYYFWLMLVDSRMMRDVYKNR